MRRPARFVLAALAAFVALPAWAADLEPLQTLRQLTQGIDGLSGAEEVVVSDDGAFIYVAAEDQDGVGIFTLNEGAGSMAFDSVASVPGPKALALAPEAMNPHLYVTSQTMNQILWYDRDPVTGALSNEMSITGNATIGLMQAWSVAISEDGLHVYVVGRADNSIAAFDRNPATGALTHNETFFDTMSMGMTSPFEVRVAPLPNDTQVVVASQGDGNVTGLAFPRAAMDPLGAPVAIPEPLLDRGSSKAVAYSPDGTSVYFGTQTLGAASPSIAIYDRDLMTDALTLNDLIDDPELLTVVSLAVSPDGNSLLAVADTNDALLSYRRSSSGGLTFFEQIDDNDMIPGGGGFVGLSGATSVVVTASGDHSLAVAKGSTFDAINLFAPEPSAGLLGAAALGALGLLAGRRSRRARRV